MIYITQFIFVKEGQEEKFLEFEQYAIPLLKEHHGKVIYRLRPGPGSFVEIRGDVPYEIHFISFDSEDSLKAFMQDERRLKFVHLKEESVQTMLLVKGEKM